MDTAEARVMLLAIALQESRFEYRAQIRGPARGYWQFERGGGTTGVVMHYATSGNAVDIADLLDYDMTGDATHCVDVIHAALADNGLLAACWARLLLWTDPYALPSIDDPSGAWDLYIRTWRPGKPHLGTWYDLHRQAVEQIRSES